MTTPPPKHRRFLQFRLRTLLIAVLVLSLPLSWFAVNLEKARRQRSFIARIVSLGGWAHYGMGPSGGTITTRLRAMVGNDYSNTVMWLFCENCPVTDDDMKDIPKFEYLNTLNLANTEITDATLLHLLDQRRIQNLILEGTCVTDKGMEHLQHLSRLSTLRIERTSVTDAGLEHLEELPDLRRLGLLDTQVTPEGVKKLQEALPNCKIEYQTPQIP